MDIYLRTEVTTVVGEAPVVTAVPVKEALAEANHAQMGGKREVRTMSSSRGYHSITYKDGRKVQLTLTDTSDARIVAALGRMAEERGMAATAEAVGLKRPERALAPVARPFYARTFSATRRHIIKPGTDNTRTLCGHGVLLPEEYINEAGELERPDAWMLMDLPPCGRCEASASAQGLAPASR